MVKVLFVCLGNICRSPMAEGIFKHFVKEAGLENEILVDSAGTIGFHAGELPNVYARKIAGNHGIRLVSRSRMIKLTDFDQFDYIVVMDRSNYQDVQEWVKQYTGDNGFQVFMMRDFDDKKTGKGVSDPYGKGDAAFEECFQVLNESCANFLSFVKQQHMLNV